MSESALSRFRAALRLLSPEHITPAGRRILEKVLDAEETECRSTDAQPEEGKKP